MVYLSTCIIKNQPNVGVNRPCIECLGYCRCMFFFLSLSLPPSFWTLPYYWHTCWEIFVLVYVWSVNLRLSLKSNHRVSTWLELINLQNVELGHQYDITPSLHLVMYMCMNHLWLWAFWPTQRTQPTTFGHVWENQTWEAWSLEHQFVATSSLCTLRNYTLWICNSKTRNLRQNPIW